MERQLRDHLELWERLIRAHSRIVGRLEEEMESAQGLSLRWYEVLLHLSRAPGGAMRMQDLAELALQSKSGLTRVVDRMEAAGLVTRQICPSDRRGVLAVITPEGRRRFRPAARVHVRGIERHFGRHLGASEPGSLRSLVDRLLEAQVVDRSPVY
ncbi:MAG: MarR family transcriptional regulator [Candidatus Nephthysia bennettiae]|uniref:MarR family transcriptional regulator n=1 Tax=Candidatus Nephthysia bennettiae TaxID=3127016 RepID=A0A934N922_9BACT|nr:MarR family transcriptional regulator [Candidatus Dormibacteraeota bacterium]MBJ7613334.1 MarR family transcriptional regulator [Candidatus Dormibacteraeota bacterium]PZS00891.1 MAG: MarR family transcriptional regulator [Candidatus Dormibacteraeota bacterium]